MLHSTRQAAVLLDVDFDLKGPVLRLLHGLSLLFY